VWVRNKDDVKEVVKQLSKDSHCFIVVYGEVNVKACYRAIGFGFRWRTDYTSIQKEEILKIQ